MRGWMSVEELEPGKLKGGYSSFYSARRPRTT